MYGTEQGILPPRLDISFPGVLLLPGGQAFCGSGAMPFFAAFTSAFCEGMMTKNTLATIMADFVVWDPEQTFTVTSDLIHHKHKITPYLNKELYGVVKQTWLGGEKVFADGIFLHLNKGHIILS